MRTSLCVAVAALGLVAADAPKPDAVKAELAKMEGTWRLAAAEVDGKQMPEEQAKLVTRTITGDKYEVTRGGKPAGKGTMTVDPTKTPKTVDAEIVMAGKDGQPHTVKVLGIYEMDGDTMKTCLADPSKPRPTEFAAKEGSGQRVFVWKREKK